MRGRWCRECVKTKMDACIAVERELDRVLSKFSGLQEHDRKTLDDIAQYVQNIRRELVDGRYLNQEVEYFNLSTFVWCHSTCSVGETCVTVNLIERGSLALT